jgi:hypothetical protein
MPRTLLSLSFAILFLSSVQSQSLYTPRNIRMAYENGTRSPDGRPGKNYWQNSGRYTISVRALPPDRTVTGSEQITYFNNSPDTLRNPVIRLVLNIHLPGATRNFPEDSTYLTQGIRIDRYTENGQPHAWREGGGTARSIRLSRPLAPHDSLQLSFDWHYQISLKSNREGMIDSTTYFLAYFYPRVSVFDDYNGWDGNEFTDLQEFYNDFNDYTLKVEVPENFVVWATGTLQNPGQVLEPAYARKLAASMSSDKITTIASGAEIMAGKVTAHHHQTNTWTWTAEHVSDMTAGLSDHFDWDASSVVVDDASGRRASVQSAYNDTARDFHSMVEYGRHALDWLSHNWPGVPYPFPKTTIFQGYADMEYPMMVNDNTTPDPVFTRFVAEHEIAHSWFPFYMGINESRYAFMDEGWATTLEYLIGQADLGPERASEAYKQFRINGYIFDPSQEEDLPIITPANALTGQAYGNNAYGKPSLAYLAAKDMLGDDLFRKCLHEYMERWHGKHPIPWDFFYTFNDVSGKDLNWFWTNWFFTNHYLDLAVDRVEEPSGQAPVLYVRNIGGFAIPFEVEMHYTDGGSESIHVTPAAWSQGSDLIPVTLHANGKKLRTVELKTGIFVDANPADNKWTAK